MDELWDWVTSGWSKTADEWGDLFNGDFYGAFGGAEDSNGDPVPGYDSSVANGAGSPSLNLPDASSLLEDLLIGGGVLFVILVLVLLILGKLEAL